MHSASYSRGSRSQKELPWKWIGIIGWIIFLLILVRIFWSGEDTSATEAYLQITPVEWSSVYISMTSSSKSRISWEQKLYASDKSVSVDVGNALAKNEFMSADIDKWTELSYISSSATGNTIEVSKWRTWIEVLSGPLIVNLKNYAIHASEWSVFMAEQNGPYSYLYSLRWDTKIQTSLGELSVPAGSMIQLTKSDIDNPNTNLTEWMKLIEWSILEYPLFVRNNGSTLLSGIPTPTLTGSWTASGELLGSGRVLSTASSRYIEITEPKSGIMIKSSTLTVMWNLLSKDVKRVTINNVDATVSPVNETFVLQGMQVSGNIIDIIYKAYDENNTLLESGVHTIYGDKTLVSASNTLVPETYNVSAWDFKITVPSSNPYTTTTWFLKVQWTVPKNKVEYIMVNDYRLQKFIPKSSSWYYFANMETGTMEEWLNLYNIKFYAADNTLLYTQPFTIIKESNNATVSGE